MMSYKNIRNQPLAVLGVEVVQSCRSLACTELVTGFEPTTFPLEGDCSTN